MRHLLILSLFVFFTPVFAHQGTHALTRSILIELSSGGTKVTVSVPALLAYSNAAAARKTPDGPIIAPFLHRDITGSHSRHSIDALALSEDPVSAAALVASVVPVTVGSPAKVLSAKAISRGSDQQMFVTNTDIEVVLLYPVGIDLEIQPIAEPPPLPHHWYMETVVRDTRQTPNIVVERIGQLRTPVLLRAP